MPVVVVPVLAVVPVLQRLVRSGSGEVVLRDSKTKTSIKPKTSSKRGGLEGLEVEDVHQVEDVQPAAERPAPSASDWLMATTRQMVRTL
jgi:hypothetical protein